MINVLYMAMSVNGMIATKTDQTPWSESVWNNYVGTIGHFGNIIVGRRTFEIMKKNGDFGSFKNKPFTVVLSGKTVADLGVETAASPMEALKLVADQGLGSALIGGGRQAATAFLKAGLIDEIMLDVEPVIIGDGIPLFDPVAIRPKLSLLDKAVLKGGIVHLHYQVED